MRCKKTPTILQMEASECGSAALGMILGYYGRWVSQEELRRVCGVSRDGVKAANIVKAAQYYDCEATAYQWDLEAVLAHDQPVIVYWNFNHFVVVEGSNHRYVFINDPASGPRKITHAVFNASYTGVAIALSPGANFQPGGSPPAPLKLFLGWLRGTKNPFILLAIVTLLFVIPGVAAPAFLKIFIDEVLVLRYHTWLVPLLAGIFISTLLAGVMTMMQQYFILRIRTKLALSSASQFFWHILRVPIGFFEQRYIGDVAARINSCQNISDLLSGPVVSSLINIFVILFFLGVMYIYSGILTAIVIVLALINIGIFLLMQRKLRDTSHHALNQEGKWNSISMMGLQAIETLKANGAETDFFTRWSGFQASNLNTYQRLIPYSTLSGTFPGTIASITNAMIYGAGGLLIINGQLTIGGLVAFTHLLTQVTTPLNQFIGFALSFQQIHGDLTRVQDGFNYQQDPLLENNTTEETFPHQLSGGVQLKQVSFAFSELTPPFLQGIDLVIEPGQRIAVVGNSGCGKSTLAQLVLGLKQPTSGEIRFDGHLITAIPRKIFTTSVAWVDQQIVLFPGTIRENLTMWDDSVPEAAMVQAAQDACIHPDIAERPGGYLSLITEGNRNFSAGQAQRLEIAKALLLNPVLLVLDEATSALDALVEQRIVDNIKKRGCACLVIAHRLSTIRDSDSIIVLDKGQIIERGNHHQLLAQKGYYAELVNSQFS